MIKIMLKHELDNEIKKDEPILIQGKFKKRLGVHIGDGKVQVQGAFGIKTVDINKFNNGSYKVFKGDKLYKFIKMR